MKAYLKLFNYIFLVLAILWLPIQIGFLQIDAKGRIMFLLTIVTFLLNISIDNRFLKKNVLSKPAIFWGLWIIFSAINHQLQGYNRELSYTFYFVHQLFTPYLVMLITTKETIRDPGKTAKLFVFVFTAFAILSITTLRGETDQLSGRYTGELGNFGPLNSIYIVFFGALLYVHRKIDLKILIPLLLFAFAVIAMAATRKAFGAALIISVMLILSQIRFSTKNIFIVSLLSLGFYFGINFAMDNTILGERFKEGLYTGEYYNTTGFQQLNYLGDRVIFYIEGWELFKENPVIGVGLKNFHLQSKYNVTIHSEYIVQLAEGGIIGTSLFLMFYIWIGLNIIKRWKSKSNNFRGVVWIIAGGYVAILFINFTAWTYEFSHYFVSFGVMIGYLKNSQYYDSNTRYRR